MRCKSFYFVILMCAVLMFQTGCRATLESSEEPPEKSMKIITYNVLYGFNHQKNMKEGAEWIKQQDPDVLALQELNGFNNQKLLNMAKQWNQDYAVILKEEGFPVGLTSKTPIEVVEKRTRGFTHGYLHCKTKGIDFIVLHLNPHSYAIRQKEADMIVMKVKKLLSENKNVVVLGDFNSFSASDKERMLPKIDLLEGQKKWKNLNQGQFDYSVMDRFDKSGLIDICDRLLPASDSQRFTFPSKIVKYAKTKQVQMKFSRRIDYIWMDPNLADQCTSVMISRDSILDSISDHFPIIATIGMP